jgi:phospholipase/carboxylesterase
VERPWPRNRTVQGEARPASSADMDPRTLTRRALLRLAGGALGAPLAAPLGTVATVLGALLPAACGGSPPERLAPAPSGATERNRAAGGATPPRFPAGTHNLGLSGERDGVVVLPERAGPLPLILMLHGAGGSGRRAARLIEPAAAELGCAILAPDSRDRTWDAITGAFGRDVRFLERALAAASEHCDLAPGRIAVAGFSDGATYALAVGLANGDRFSHVLAFSPGFLIPGRRVGSPRVFVSHGRQDDVLPIDSCSRVMVPRLRKEGYAVDYREFDGRHEAPAEMVRQGVGLFAGG